MKSVGIPALEKAVSDYYEYQGDRNIHAVCFVENRKSAGIRSKESGTKMNGYSLLLSRFISEAGRKMSALMEYTNWADGHWDVTEVFFCPRDCEAIMVKNFEDSEDYL